MLKLIASIELVRRQLDETSLRRAVRSQIAPFVSEDDMTEMVKDAVIKTYASSETLFKEGDAADGLHLIRRGSVTISRLIGGKPQRVHLFWHKVGNKALSLVTNVLYNTTLSDMETGYKAFTLEVLRSIEPLYESDFRIEPELTAKICRGGFRIYEVPIAYYGRSYEEGKKITWRDGFPAVYALVKYRFRDR